jgi:hypothetical protein
MSIYRCNGRYAPTTSSTVRQNSRCGGRGYNARAALSVFTLDKVLEHGETYTPALSTYVYIMIVNGSGYNQQQYYMNPIALGEVAIQMLPTPTAAYINGLSTKGGATLNQTDDSNWRIFIQNVDADYEISDNYGYRTTLRYDSMDAMENILDYTTYNVIEWDTNSTTMTTSDKIEAKRSRIKHGLDNFFIQKKRE